MLAFTEVTSMRLLLRRTQFRKTQFRKTLSLVVTFLALALSLTSAAPAQKPNVGRSASPQSAPFYAYRNLPAQMDPGRIGSSNFEAMEAQERLAQAQRSYAMRNAEPQPARNLHQNQLEPQQLAQPDAPDQSDLLKNSKDPDYILKNFRTMWVDAREAQYFGSDQMKAALDRNKEFHELNIHMVDDPHLADVLLNVSYTFAWDYPFQLKHQNTTIVLLAGKGEGPFSGPLGAADVAYEFVKAVKRYRATAKNQQNANPEKQDDKNQKQ
jgi:hypothetical protein